MIFVCHFSKSIKKKEEREKKKIDIWGTSLAVVHLPTTNLLDCTPILLATFIQLGLLFMLTFCDHAMNSSALKKINSHLSLSLPLKNKG